MILVPPLIGIVSVMAAAPVGHLLPLNLAATPVTYSIVFSPTKHTPGLHNVVTHAVLLRQVEEHVSNGAQPS
jgi:hypothetical protein